MGYNVYCAICSGPLHDVYSREEAFLKSRKANRFRRLIIAAGRHERYGEGTADVVKKCQHMDSALETLSDDCESDSEEGDKPGDADANSQRHILSDKFVIENAYDPRVLEGLDTSWLQSVRFLVRDPAMKTVSKCFISNAGRYDDYNWASATGHPERPGESLELQLYTSYVGEETPSYPCHEACLQMFGRFVTGSPDVARINPDLLFEVMDQDIGTTSRALDLDYGDQNGAEQFWDCRPGEEYTVTDPSDQDILDSDTVRALLLDRQLTTEARVQRPAKPPQTDPFRCLSVELVAQITDFMTGHDVLQLSQASMAVLEATDDMQFWHRLCKREIGWLWEVLQDLDAIRGEVNWKHVYMLADHITDRPWGMRGDYMSLANRRRIWRVCSQIAVHYLQRVASTEAVKPSLADSAITMHMPLVSFPVPERSSPFSNAIDSWDTRTSGTTLSLGWNGDNELSEICFNQLSVEAHARASTIEIPQGDWIQSLTLFINPLNVLKYQNYPPPSAAVLGVSVLMYSGAVHDLGDLSETYNRRYLAPSQNREVVGFVGRTDDQRGCVHALAVLETHRFPDPEVQPGQNAILPEKFRYLWTPESVLVPSMSTGHMEKKMHEIWRHPNLTVEAPRKSSFEDFSLLKDLIPMQVILYDERDVSSIEVMITPDGKTTDGHGNVVRHNTRVIGIRMCLSRGPMQPWSTVGSIPPPEYNEYKNQHLHGWESRDYVQRFDIDGANGEALDAISTEISQGLKAVRFRTNRNREMTFGSGSGNNAWESQEFSSANGPRLVGFACGFGTASGHVWLGDNANKSVKTLAALTCITALTVKR